MGIMIIPANLMMPSIARIISVFLCLTSLAFCVSLAAYESFPTAVNLARHFPEMIELPDFKSLPITFSISSSSPVRRDSLTATFPSTKVASAGICLPSSSKMMSSSTNSSIGTDWYLPSLITW